MAGTKRFNLTIKTPDGELPPAHIEVTDEPMRLSEIVPLLHELANKTIGLAIDRAGCGVCCRQLVPVAPAEVFYIVERLMSLPLADRRGPLEKFQENETRLNDTGLLTAIADLGSTRDNNAVAREYFRLDLPCPFLNNQSCSIHAWRPLACREYNVVSPASHCADPFNLKIETIGLYRRLSERLGRLSSHAVQLPVGMVPMPLLFDYFEAHKEASRMAFPGAELVELALDVAFGKNDR
jgi:Fe-S-cluster containining protein